MPSFDQVTSQIAQVVDSCMSTQESLSLSD